MQKKKLLLKILLVSSFIALVESLPTGGHGESFDFSFLGGLMLIALPILLVVAILQKWYTEYKSRKAETIQAENIPKVSVEKEENVRFLIFINIIFTVFSLINSLVVTELASLRGSARAQGEFLFILPALIYIILAIITSVISYRYLHKQYIFRGWLALLLLPYFGLATENFGIFLLDSGFNYFLIVLLMTIITMFVFFSPSFTHLFTMRKLETKR